MILSSFGNSIVDGDIQSFNEMSKVQRFSTLVKLFKLAWMSYDNAPKEAKARTGIGKMLLKKLLYIRKYYSPSYTITELTRGFCQSFSQMQKGSGTP